MTMNSEERALTRHLFKNKIHEANGQKFEDIFTKIMNYAEPDFRQIKPWGNIGDRKNDGYISTKGIFFQVFAPEDIKKSYSKAVKKLNTDFKGLIKQWPNVNEYYFVVNDKYSGVHADCEQVIQQIKNDHQLKDAGFRTAKDLENILHTLDDDQILSIAGFLPDPSKIKLDYSVLNEIIAHIMGLSLKTSAESRIIYPDWDDKVRFNELNGLFADYLNHGFIQVGALNAYLENESNFFANELQKKISSIYAAKKENFKGSKLFWEMVHEISPRAESPYQTAAIVIMAKYFETCDIFEEPE